MQYFSAYYLVVASLLERQAYIIPPLFLRLLLAWEFGEAGYAKLTGRNWFQHIAFPFPFNVLPPEINWQIATSFELAGAMALVLGLATRFFSAALMVLTLVAIATVHWPVEWQTLAELLTGYRIIDEQGDGLGNYKLPVIFLVMFLPLLFSGGGKLSFDHWLYNRLIRKI